jgi:hypothetical protein
LLSSLSGTFDGHQMTFSTEFLQAAYLKLNSYILKAKVSPTFIFLKPIITFLLYVKQLPPINHIQRLGLYGKFIFFQDFIWWSFTVL